jgi:hypothetical protein
MKTLRSVLLLALVAISILPAFAEDKQIASCKQDGSTVYVYDENGTQMFTKSGELVGYTSHTVSIREGGTSQVNTYDSNGTFKYNK